MSPPPPVTQQRSEGMRRRRTQAQAAAVVPAAHDFSSHSSSSISSAAAEAAESPKSLPLLPAAARHKRGSAGIIVAAFRWMLPAVQSLMTSMCRRAAPVQPERRTVSATFFGAKKGRVSLVVQHHPRGEPLLLLDLALTTAHLVKEMASGSVRLLLECNKLPAAHVHPSPALWAEPLWATYCNGRRCGYTVSRTCTPADLQFLTSLQAISIGAGVLPSTGAALPSPARSSFYGDCGGEVVYMRAEFERVSGSRDSGALYMISPECVERKGRSHGRSHELSIFFLRI